MQTEQVFPLSSARPNGGCRSNVNRCSHRLGTVRVRSRSTAPPYNRPLSSGDTCGSNAGFLLNAKETDKRLFSKSQKLQLILCPAALSTFTRLINCSLETQKSLTSSAKKCIISLISLTSNINSNKSAHCKPRFHPQNSFDWNRPGFVHSLSSHLDSVTNLNKALRPYAHPFHTDWYKNNGLKSFSSPFLTSFSFPIDPETDHSASGSSIDLVKSNLLKSISSTIVAHLDLKSWPNSTQTETFFSVNSPSSLHTLSASSCFQPSSTSQISLPNTCFSSKNKMPVLCSSIQFRNLKPEEIPRVLELCRKEGRHMGQEAEVRTWFEIDPSGFFVAVNSEGKLKLTEMGLYLLKNA